MSPLQKNSLRVIAGNPQIEADNPQIDAGGLPSCLYPLRTHQARSEYDGLATALIRAGKLTVDAHRLLSEYAIQFDCLHISLADGLPIRASRFDQLKRARKALKLRDLDKPEPEPAPVRENKFATCGFSNRRQ